MTEGEYKGRIILVRDLVFVLVPHQAPPKLAPDPLQVKPQSIKALVTESDTLKHAASIWNEAVGNNTTFESKRHLLSSYAPSPASHLSFLGVGVIRCLAQSKISPIIH